MLRGIKAVRTICCNKLASWRVPQQYVKMRYIRLTLRFPINRKINGKERRTWPSQQLTRTIKDGHAKVSFTALYRDYESSTKNVPDWPYLRVIYSPSAWLIQQSATRLSDLVSNLQQVPAIKNPSDPGRERRFFLSRPPKYNAIKSTRVLVLILFLLCVVNAFFSGSIRIYI